jgi:hypothetical protein
MSSKRGEVPEQGAVPEQRVDARAPQIGGGDDVALLRDLDDRLHAMSQPITILLCTLEFGRGLDSVEEIKRLLLTAREASERLRETALAMRAQLQLALQRS